MRVALVVMPFAAADRPSLAAGLLQAQLRREAIDCDSKYFNLTFWKLLGSEAYRSLSQESSITPLAGEWVFSQAFYGQRFSTWESYRQEVLDDPLWGVGRRDRAAIRAAADAAPSFLRLAFESNDWGRYDLVGFTSTFEQTLASLCLARMIRERHSGVRIALGGANFEAGMGRPYLESFDFVDFISTGEADISFPALCRQLRDVGRGRRSNIEVPAGFLYRRGGEVCGEAALAGGAAALDELPTPDYDDFFRVASAFADGRPPQDGDPTLPWLPVEASRGCWWGEKAHCTFCGLNGDTMDFRRKGWRRVVAETDELRARHGDLPLQFADNILGMSYFEDLLPFWARREGEPTKFFEIKANLNRRQLALLHDAGILFVQPGIESLADDTLKVMQKGVSAAQNVAVLRWCAELGIGVSWNLLYGFPRERLDGYGENLAALSKLTHLPAPNGCGAIRMDRFSPNFVRWREHGFSALEPMPAYRHVYPFADDRLRQLAYYFRYRHPQLEAALAEASKVDGLCREWRDRDRRDSNGELAVKPHWRDGFVLVDSRYNLEPRSWRLSAVELALLLACDAPTSRETTLRRAARGDPAANGDVEAALERLLERSVIAEVGRRLVTLALLPPRSEIRGQ